MRAAVVKEGLRTGVVLAGCVVALAYVGLTPSFSWFPEAPLVVVAVAAPIVAFAISGSRAGARSGAWLAGALAGAATGAIGGGVGGLAYAIFGKPMLNIPVGLVLGAIGGAVVGAGSAWSALRRRRQSPAGPSD